MKPAIDIRALRLNRGLSLSEAARQIDLAPNTLAGAESGEITPWPSNALKIAKFYGFQVTDIWPIHDPAAEAA